jgi:pimeloyl-ACP methyl ester carboxylesterase
MIAILLMTLAQFIAYTRAELAKGGLERMAADDAVYWVGGPSPRLRGEGAASAADEGRHPAGIAPHPAPAAPPSPRERGEGSSAVVLLHGSNDQAGTWFAVAPALAKKHRVIVPDLAGHGESGPREGPLPLSLLVARLHAVLEREGTKRVTLVGSSMGGWVAMLYAMKYPEQVERLVLEDASGMMWPLSVPLVAANRDDAIKILHAVHGPKAETPEWAIAALLEPNAGELMKRVIAGGVLEYLVDEKLQSLKAPVTLIWGRDDGLLPLAYAEALQKKIAGSKLFVIDGAAHMPHRQQPERFLECLSKSSSPSGRE